MGCCNKTIKAICILIVFFSSSYAQIQKVQQGVVFRKGTTVRIAKAEVRNKRAGYSITTNNLGLFTILASRGDTLEISHEGYVSQQVMVSTFQDQLIFLLPSNLLQEVKITGESVKQQLNEIENSYKRKGIYYKGRPPLYLLAPIRGHPLTFFHELLSKDGKRARRGFAYVQNESDYYEVASRFNDYNIKRIVPVKDEDLKDFKGKYWPKAELVRTWNDFDLFKYIKISYQDFLKAKGEE